MKKEKSAEFIWTGPSGDWSGGRLHLVHGKIYKTDQVEADVLAHWIAQGAAEMVDVKNEEK